MKQGLEEPRAIQVHPYKAGCCTCVVWFQVLVKQGLEEPRAIQVHPYKGWLFYTDWGDHAHIGRIGMDGTIPKQRNIISDNLGWPNALTIDYVAEHIIWADARYIFTARKQSLGQGNVFTRVCHSVHRGEGVFVCVCVGASLPDRETPLNRDPRTETPRTETPPYGKERTVLILLECILIDSVFNNKV